MGEFYGVQRGSAGATPTMIRVIRICRKCGAKIFSDAPEGLCAKCVLKIALGAFPDAVAGVGDSGRVEQHAGEDRASASQDKTTGRAAELLGELGDYELLEEIGRGGRRVVFRARYRAIKRRVPLNGLSIG